MREAGHDAIHVVECDLAGAPDDQVLARADVGRRILLSADTDFGEILARSLNVTPSVILVRRPDRSAKALVSVLLANIVGLTEDLTSGAFIVITTDRIRIRNLPMK